MRHTTERNSLNTSTTRVKRSAVHAGAAHVAIVVLLSFSLVSAGLYVYAVNRSAVQGYAIRTLEKDLKELKKANAELRVREAEAISLTRVEAGSLDLRMEKAETTTVITTHSNTVAIR
ncbi:MAG: hypothetical protein WBO92_04635 [Candidatus Moraniibacteriota bacterium]